jgi:hypothetical protein
MGHEFRVIGKVSAGLREAKPGLFRAWNRCAAARAMRRQAKFHTLGVLPCCPDCICA